MNGLVVKRSKRLLFLDLAKLIGIMLIIAAHRFNNRLFRMFLHSFHVPLFFIISGYTFSFSTNRNEFLKKTLKRFLRLLVPYFITLLVFLILDLSLGINTGSPKNFIIDFLYKFVGYGSPVFHAVFAIWFLFALFTASTLFDLVHLITKQENIFAVVCFTLSIVGVILGKVLKYSPFYFDIGLAVLSYMYIGYKLKNIDLEHIKFWKILIIFVVWGLSMVTIWFSKDIGTYLSIADRRYPLFPLDFICAVSGSILVLILCLNLTKYLPRITKPLCFLGRYTLYMICVHTFAWFYFPLWFNYSSNLHLNNLIYFGIGSAIFFVILIFDLLIHNATKKRQT